MPDNSEGSGKRPRGVGRRFVKGQSGNPKGRPRTNDEFRELARENEDVMLKKLFLLGLKGTGNTAVKAIELRLAYARGRPKVITEVTGKDGQPLEREFPEVLQAFKRLGGEE